MFLAEILSVSLQPSRKMGTFIVLLSPLKYHVKATHVAALAQAQGLPGMRQVLVEVSKRFSWLKKKKKQPNKQTNKSPFTSA